MNNFMSNTKEIITILNQVDKYLNEFISGNLILLVDIRENFQRLKKEFEKVDSLNKLTILVDYMIKIIEIASKDKDKENRAVSLLQTLVKLLLAFFLKKITSKELAVNINANLSLIRELLAVKIKRKKETKKEKESYPENYFSNLVDDEKLFSQFYQEATEHLDQAQLILVELEHDSTNKELINNIFRNFHTIKGSSAFLGLKNIEEISHSIEDMFDLVRKEKLILSKELLDIIFFGIELIRTILDVMNTEDFKKEEMKKAFLLIDIFPYIDLMKKILSEYQIKKIGEILAEDGVLSIKQLEDLLNKQKIENKRLGQIAIEEKVASPEDVALALKKQEAQKVKTRRLGYVKVSNERLNTLIDIVGELVINQSMLKQQIMANRVHFDISDRTLTELENITTTIKNLVLSMGMLPISEIFNKMKVIARNTSLELGKTVFVDVEGEDTELDRNVMETIYDPLMHIVRNAIDHGIEPPEEREKVGKSKIGKILLKAEHKGSGIEITVADDGRGIDRNKILEKAIKMNLIENKDTISDKDLYNFLFLPGFTTNENVSSVSGRGVGLDVVKKNLELIHGRVEIQSEVGKGTKIIIKLPLTLAIIEGFVTRVGQNKYVFPFNLIDEILVFEKKRIIYSQNNEDTLIFHRGMHVPVIFANKIFKEKNNFFEKETLISLIINFDQFKYCIVVDEVLGKQEIVVKNLGNILQNYKFFSGGTIFGDGSIGFVVDFQGLLETLSK